MAFTDFKSADEVQKAYQIRYVEKDFITLCPKALPEYFVQGFEFNRDNFGNEAIAIYGIVTDGKTWQFGQLLDKVFTKNLSRATIDRLEEVYGAVFGLIDRLVAPSKL